MLNSIVLAEPPGDRTRVPFGAAVTIRRGDGEEERYRIMGVEEAEPESGSISWMSPLARAVLSRKAAETVRFREAELTVVSVEY